jgi:sigma-B regulation protein RsbU (phosphoserine phosphatase)
MVNQSMVRRHMGRDDHATLTMLRFSSDGRLAYAGAHEDIIVKTATPNRSNKS